ncbi:hypothetical protein HZB89_00480 [archaeon]|nr:hypothetical protein [archaeon]
MVDFMHEKRVHFKGPIMQWSVKPRKPLKLKRWPITSKIRKEESASIKQFVFEKDRQLDFEKFIANRWRELQELEIEPKLAATDLMLELNGRLVDAMGLLPNKSRLLKSNLALELLVRQAEQEPVKIESLKRLLSKAINQARVLEKETSRREKEFRENLVEIQAAYKLILYGLLEPSKEKHAKLTYKGLKELSFVLQSFNDRLLNGRQKALLGFEQSKIDSIINAMAKSRWLNS